VHEDQKWLEKVDNQCEAQSDLPFSFLFSLRPVEIERPQENREIEASHADAQHLI